MQLPLLTLPRAVPLTHQRPTQETIPPSRAEREYVRSLASVYVARVKPTIPLSLDELRHHATTLVSEAKLPEQYRDYVGVVLNSEANRDALAGVPYERRLLLLPKCLRVEERCPAPFDEFGLLCKQCGLCTIQDLQNEAEKLGYAVLVAEGSALVMAIIQTGKIDAIVGVSCLSVLEKAFPYMEAAAIPGVAIPLLQDDCKDTGIDVEWVWDFIHLNSEDRTYRMNLEEVRLEVESWFTEDSLDRILNYGSTQSERIARAWLSKAGKRWRPFLTACLWRAMQDDPTRPFPDDLKKLAVAVECFHKASLIHDDIEDDDAVRYGESTVHTEHGVAVALNIGDLLLGDGYRLIAEVDCDPAVRSQMLRIAAEGHRTLCLGQGDELTWTNAPKPLTPLEVVSIHHRKTSPAFEVALRIGAAYAGADRTLHSLLTKYSESLGIAYQIRDDLDDLHDADARTDLASVRPSFPLAVAYERSKDGQRAELEAVWTRQAGRADAEQIRQLIAALGAEERTEQMLESYKEQAIRVLMEIDNPTLKGLLRRVVSKIFSIQIKGWCREFETRNAASRPVSTKAAGGID